MPASSDSGIGHHSAFAPCRHFVDRRALLAAVATAGFDKLAAAHREAMGKTPQARLAAAGRSYLAFAAERPQRFRLMLASDLLSGATAPPDPALIKAATTCYEVFEGLVAATLEEPNDGAVKATAIALMCSAYGFALLRMDNRLRPFMYGRLTQAELVDAVLSMQVNARPRTTRHKRGK